MKKTIIAFGCVIVLLLAGCQTQLNPPSAAAKSNQTVEDNTSDPSSTSDDTSVNTDAGTDQTDKKDSTETDPTSEGDTDNTPTQSETLSGDGSWSENGASNHATLVDEERELKNEGSLHGEIEVTHKLSCGKKNLADGATVLFRLESPSSSAELKISLIGTQTGTILEGIVTESDALSFEIDIADEYSVVLENCLRSAVQFAIDYSFGGSK